MGDHFVNMFYTLWSQTGVCFSHPHKKLTWLDLDGRGLQKTRKQNTTKSWASCQVLEPSFKFCTQTRSIQKYFIYHWKSSLVQGQFTEFKILLKFCPLWQAIV